METRAMRKKRLGPLPEGNRRGASGADAGCLSMRTIGGEELSRRALVDQINITADDHDQHTLILVNNKLSSTTPSSPLSSPESASVAQATNVNILVPSTDVIRARKKWTDEMNIFIWRTYLTVTSLETNTKKYLTTLTEQFNINFPEMNATKQRLGDQKRAIIRNKLLSTSLMDKIRSEVSETILQTPQINATEPTRQTKLTRMKWSNDINETIIKIYYSITELETNKTSYRQGLHKKIIELFPHLSHLSEQRIADQRRAIFSNKLITETRLKEIRKEVESTLHNSFDEINKPVSHTSPITEILDQQNSNISQIENESSNVSENDVSNLYKKITTIFESTYNKYKNTYPTDRPYIPKQYNSKLLDNIVNYLNNIILPKFIHSENDFITTQTLIYSAAYTSVICNGMKIKENNFISKKVNQPLWQQRLQNKVESLRRDLARLIRYTQGVRSQKLNKLVIDIRKRHITHSRHEEPNLTDCQILDTIKQKLSLTSNRLKRYINCTNRKTQNKQFKNNEKVFYRNISNSTDNLNNTISPSIDDQYTFWSNIWSNPIQHNINAEWIQRDALTNLNLPEMQFKNIPLDIFLQVIKKTHNWKAPGTDNIHNYWYKKFTSMYPILHNHINKFLQSPETIPTYFMEGKTYLIPKNSQLDQPQNYRPITCLQTIYKITTACISDLIYQHITTNNIMTEEQKGCRKLSQGCKEQLLIDSIVMKHASKYKKDISTMYIDYKKAYDSIPHSWLLHTLQNYKIHPTIVTFLETTMKHWQTKLITNSNKIQTQTETINIRRGIFQGDALSPLWFCLALNPLSHMLNKSNCGYSLKNNGEHITLSHLLYMDDIKLFSNKYESLEILANITQTFSNDIQMEFGIDKCKTFNIKHGIVQQNSYILQTGVEIEPIEPNSSYKYLGFQQSRQIHVKEIKHDLKNKFKHRLNKLLKSQLNSRNLIKAINTYAISILTYSFGIISWSQTDLCNLQRIINTSMTKNRKHHPRSCLQRLTLPRDEGGRGIIDIVNLHNKQITTLRNYFHSRAEHSILHRAVSHADKKLTPINLNNYSTQDNQHITEPKHKLEIWMQKTLHSRHRHDLLQPSIDKLASNAWLRYGELFPETEGFMIAIQDQIIETRNYIKYIIKKPNTTDTCRRCKAAPEHIQHITGSCRAIVQTDYKHRHDQVANIIHQKLAHKYKLISDPILPYYKYTPKIILENTLYKLYFDRAILTDKTTHNNRPDITLVDKLNKKTFIIDIAIPNTHNIQTTISEKLRKYTDLKDEITRIWNMDHVSIIPIVLSSTGVIPHSLHQSLKLLDLAPQTYISLQKAAILNTCRIVRKFLQTEIYEQ